MSIHLPDRLDDRNLSRSLEAADFHARMGLHP